LPKRTPGATGKNLKVEPSSFLAPDHPPAAKKTNRIRKGVKRSYEEVLKLMVIPLPQGLHTQR
jgi:hypothetical protein